MLTLIVMKIVTDQQRQSPESLFNTKLALALVFIPLTTRKKRCKKPITLKISSFFYVIQLACFTYNWKFHAKCALNVSV